MNRVQLVVLIGLWVGSASASVADLKTLRPSGDEDSAFAGYGAPCGYGSGGASDPSAKIYFYPGGYIEPYERGLAIIHFSLDGIPPGGLKPVGGAVLNIYRIENGNARLRHEEGVVGQNAIGSEYCDVPLSAPIPGLSSVGWRAIDVTQYVATDIAAGRAYAGFIVDTDDQTQGKIALSEDPDGNGPFLAIATLPDTSPPSRPIVTDDGVYTADTTSLHASWTSVDPESGIRGFEYAIGSTPNDPGSGYIVQWTNAGFVDEVTKTGLSLAPGLTYHWYVRSINGAGLKSQTGTSDGIGIDLTPPGAPVVTDDGTTPPFLSQLHASWRATDDKSAIAEYAFAIGTTPSDPGTAYLADWTSAGPATEASVGDLVLPPGSTCYFYVRARNAVGLWGPVGASDGITVPVHYAKQFVRPSGDQDGFVYAYGSPGATDVVPGTAYGYVGVDVSKWFTQYNTTIIHFPLDNIGAFDRVLFGLTNRAGMLSHIDGVVGNDIASADFSKPHSLVTTGTYYADVTAQVSSDITAGRAYSAFRLDAPDSPTVSVPLSASGSLVSPYLKFVSFTAPAASAPSTPVVVDDGDTTASTNQLHASWSSSDPSSEIVSFAYAISESSSAPPATGDWSYTASSEVAITDLRLYDAHTYYIHVRAMNSLGIWSEPGVSDGIMVSSSPAFVDRNRIAEGDSDEPTAWCDYTNDGWLDIGMTASILRNNADDTFSATQAIGGWELAWGDYDGDGRSDLALGSSDGARILHNEEGDALAETDIPAVLGWVNSISWIDYDNDGDLDLVASGRIANGLPYESRIHRNDGAGSFSLVDVGIAGARGPLFWADYDNDGDMDVLATGGSAWRDSHPVTVLCRNDSGAFVDSGIVLPQVQGAHADWGDFDADGDLDLVLAGTQDSGDGLIGLFRNTGNGFTQIALSVGTTYCRGVGWGDYDNDGDIDLAIAGPGGTYGVKLLENQNGMLTDSGLSVDARGLGSLNWGDYNNDGRLDMIAAGTDVLYGSSRHLYTNNLDVLPNIPPSAPSGLQAAKDSGSIRFSWQPADDAQTPSAALSYNLRVGTAPGKQDVMPAMADPVTGFRRIVALGNVNTNLSWTLRNMPPGVYYWSVQAIDAAYAGGAWAPDEVIVTADDLTPPSTPAVTDEGLTTTSRTTLHAQWTSTDPESGIVEYKYAIGTTPADPGIGYVFPWTSTGTAPQATPDGLSLTAGHTYYFYVRARNGSGMWSATGASDGISALADVLYSNDFSAVAGPEWSIQQTDITPGTPQHPADGFLGQFGNGDISLTLDRLPPHGGLRVSFDLYVIRSWDGNQIVQGGALVGPDRWRLMVSGGPTLLLTTFSNTDFNISFTYRQAYPGAFPGGDYPPRSGAAEVNTLGFLVDYGGLYQGALDAVYHFSYEVQHSAATLSLLFSAAGLQDISDESWGIDNVIISSDKPVVPTAPDVRDDGPFTTDPTELHASWTLNDPSVVEYEYAISTDPSDTGVYVVPWTSTGTATDVARSGLSLPVGNTYYFLAKARGLYGGWGPYGTSNGITVVQNVARTPGEAKLLPDGAVAALGQAVVTATSSSMGGRAYVQSIDRSSGIAIATSSPLEEGDIVQAVGALATVAGERILSQAHVEKAGHQDCPTPLTLSLRNAASRPFFFDAKTGAGQRGVTDPPPYGLSSIGQLVRVSGAVLDMDASFVYVNDGSWPGLTGIRVSRAYVPEFVGVLDFVSVTGISTMRQTGSVYQMLIQPRRPEDVEVGGSAVGISWLLVWRE